MAKIPKARHRPVLTDQQVLSLATILKRAYVINLSLPPYSPEIPNDTTRAMSPGLHSDCLELMTKMDLLKHKIEIGAASPAYVTKGKQSLEESLGLIVDTDTSNVSSDTKEDRWELAYNKWKANPLECTRQEIDDANEHRYLNGLMTLQETEQYESALLFLASENPTDG